MVIRKRKINFNQSFANPINPVTSKPNYFSEKQISSSEKLAKTNITERIRDRKIYIYNTKRFWEKEMKGEKGKGGRNGK